MKIVFSEGSGLNDSVYGKCQAPIRMFLEQRGEQFEQQSVLKDLFLMGTSDNYGDMLTTMTAMSGFEPVGENGAYPADGMQEGYRKLLVYDTWKDSFAISAEMIEDSKLMALKKQPAAFLTGYNRTREIFGAALLGNAIRGNAAAQYHGKSFDINAADGVTLFHTAHPPKVAGDNQCNSFKDEFSVDALGKLETAMHLFRGDNDEILDVAPDTIVIPENADLKKAVFAAIGADKDPVTANNAFNYQYGRWTVIVWSYLNQFITAGTKPWLLLDSKYNKTYGGAVYCGDTQREQPFVVRASSSRCPRPSTRTPTRTCGAAAPASMPPSTTGARLPRAASQAATSFLNGGAAWKTRRDCKTLRSWATLRSTARRRTAA